MKKPTKVKAVEREAQWEILHDQDHENSPRYYWGRFKGANGEIVALSETYTRKANAIKAIKLLQASAGAKVVDLTKGAK